MQMLFVDESGTPPPPGKLHTARLFVLGGLVVPEDLWSKVAADLRRLKAKYGVAGEIKWRYFAPEKGGKIHSLSHLDAASKDALRVELYEVVTSYRSIRLICVVADIQRAYGLSYVNTADDLYWQTYKQLLERFQYYLRDLERTVGQRVNGIVVCDHRAARDDERLRELHSRLLAGDRGNVTRYGNLIEGLFIAPSHLSVGIQLADMVAGAVFRRFNADDGRFFSQIEGSFRRAPDGKIDGYGIVRFPKNGSG
jgi:hypothetical protein